MFFAKLKKLCDEKGISTYKACTDIGLNRAAVAKWKNGSIPSGSTATKLATYFGVSVDYLLDNENKNTPAEAGKRVDGGLNLTDREIYLIHLFRKLDDRNQSATFSFINSLYETQPGEKANPAPKEA